MSVISKPVVQKKNRLLLLNLIVQPFTNAGSESGGLETGRPTNGRSDRRPCVIHIRVCVRIMNRVSSGYYL